MEGHVGDVNVAKFFPSGKVILSGGLLLKVWSIEHGCDCVAELIGHRGGILCCDFVGKGIESI